MNGRCMGTCPDCVGLQARPLCEEEIARYSLENGAGVIRFFSTTPETVFSGGVLAIWQISADIKIFIYVAIDGTAYAYTQAAGGTAKCIAGSEVSGIQFPDILPGRPLAQGERADLTSILRMTMLRSVIHDSSLRAVEWIWAELFVAKEFMKTAVRKREVIV